MNLSEIVVVVLCYVVLTLAITEIDVVTDEQLNDSVSQNEFVLALFQSDPCTGEDCAQILYETSMVAAASLIPALKTVRLVNSKALEKLSRGTRSTILFYRKTVPIYFDSEAVQSDDVIFWLEQNKETNCQRLGSDNFEHLTQASTGATTGDWFVLFQSPACDHLLPFWETVGSHLKHKMNVAVVDTVASPELTTRLQITKCPTIIFFRLGKMYKYDLPMSDLKSFLHFGEGWYVNTPSQAVPKEPTPFDILIDDIVAWLKEMNVSDPLVLKSAAVVGISLVSLLLVTVCFCSRSKADRKKEKVKDE